MAKEEKTYIDLSYLEYFWLQFGRGMEWRMDSEDEEGRRYKKRLGILKLSKRNNDKEDS